MFSFFSFSFAIATSFLILAQAQTPPGFTPSSLNSLGVIFGRNALVQWPGYPLSVEETATPPTLSAYIEAGEKSTYMVFMIDVDVVAYGTPTTLLHWYQSDLRINPDTQTLTIKCDAKSGAPYGGPAPPAGSTHRYVELMFRQPKGYTFPKCFAGYLQPTIPARLSFNMTEFMDVASLEDPVAAKYFTVTNTESEATTEFVHEL